MTSKSIRRSNGSAAPARAPTTVERRQRSAGRIGDTMPIEDIESLRRHLQWALQVEHGTLPPTCARSIGMRSTTCARIRVATTTRTEAKHACE
jgi:hypothetical protein